MNDQYRNSSDPNFKLDLPKEIHPSVQIGRNVTLGMCCIIEENVIIEDDCFIGHHVLIRPQSIVRKGAGIRSFCLLDPCVELGENSQVYPHATIGGWTKIGKDVYYGPYTLTTNSAEPGKIDPPIIKDGAIIYAGCMIGPGVIVGEGAIVGMGSVLTKSVPSMEVWHGTCAKYKRRVIKRDYGLDEEDPWPSVMLEFLEELKESNER